MASVAFAYNGSNECVATVTGAVVGHNYQLSCLNAAGSTPDADVAVTSTVVLTVSDIGGFDAFSTRFDVFVQDLTDNAPYVGATVFENGSTSEFGDAVIWYYDGIDTVTATFQSLNQTGGDDTCLRVRRGTPGGTNTTNCATGDGSVIVLSGGNNPTGDFYAKVYTEPDGGSGYSPFANRLFTDGVAGRGSPGSPVPASAAQVIVTLDGVDVTDFSLTGSWTRRLNRPSTAQIRCPMENVSASVGSALKIEALVNGLWKIVHHGRVLLAETDTAEDGGYTVYNSTDPMELWQWRPVRDNDCDFTKPNIIDSYTTGPLILEAALQNSIYCGDGSQADCEGALFLDINAAAGGGVDLTGAPTDWPMTIAELASLLISTGELDVVITPTDPGGGVMGSVDFYNGDYGQDLSATIVFSYGMGDFNVRRLRWNQDMTNMANKLWYYGGPRIATAADPAGDQHWCFNVTGDDPNLAFPPGGKLSPPASSTNNQLGVLRVTSESTYGVRMDIQIFDAYDECAGVGAVGRDLFRRRWQQESWLRAVPREIIHVTPTRETEIGTFDIGDLVGVEAASAVRGGFSGAQRVYEYTVSWDNDGVLELSELQTSADNEGL